MINNFVLPEPGEIIFLTCRDCKNMFKGPNSGYGLKRLFSKTKCPDCGGKKIFPHPAIHY